jgi:prepilin-type N-terminal cleavage/methylation domain-containing protein
MNPNRKHKFVRGFTLVEMITVVFILGLILTLLSYEFLSVIDDTLRTRSNTDAESQARVIMQKIETHMRVAYYDYVDMPPGSPIPVVSPLPQGSATPAPYVVFYRVSAGGLANTTPRQCGPGVGNSALTGAPCPPFELVTIQLNPLNPGELDELITDLPSMVQEPPIVLGTNVTSFGVTAISYDEYNVSLTVTQPSSPNYCANQNCSFTIDDNIYVGGGYLAAQ